MQQLPSLQPFICGATTALEIYNLIQRLSNALLPRSIASAALTERIQQLLTLTTQHANQLSILTATHNSGPALIEAFITQVGDVTASTGSANASNSADDGASNGSVNAQSMTTVLRSPEFADFSNTLAGLDLSLHSGQLDVIETALLSGLPLMLRVLFKNETHIVKRSPALAQLAEYRNLLGAYFGRALAINISTNAVPERAANFVINTTGVKVFMTFDFTSDMFNGPYGLLTLQQLITGGALKFAAINKLDFWCQVQYIDSFRDYLNRILTAIGVPPTVPANDGGYTLTTWCEAYKAILALVITLGTEDEQYTLLKTLHALFNSFLKSASNELSRVTYSSSPDTARFGSLVAKDAPPALELCRVRKLYFQYNDHREIANMMADTKAVQSARLLHYPLFSRLAAERGGGGKQREGKAATPNDTASNKPDFNKPGSAAHAAIFLSKTELLLCGRVWNLPKVEGAYGAGKCLPYMLSLKNGPTALLTATTLRMWGTSRTPRQLTALSKSLKTSLPSTPAIAHSRSFTAASLRLKRRR